MIANDITQDINISVTPRQMREAAYEIDMPVGYTLSQLLESLKIPVDIDTSILISVNEHYIHPDEWSMYVPEWWNKVIISIAPQAPLGAAISSIIASISTTFGATLLLPTTLTSASIGKFIVYAGLGYLAGLVLNALVAPPTVHDPGQTEILPSVTGIRNRTLPNGVMPRPIGRHKMFPPKASPSHTEIAGDKQFLHTAFVIGIGPNRVTDMRFGDTSINEFEGVTTVIQRLHSDPIIVPTVDILEFNGVDDFASVADDSAFDLTEGYAIEIGFRVNSFTDNIAPLVYKGNRFSISVNDEGSIKASITVNDAAKNVYELNSRNSVIQENIDHIILLSVRKFTHNVTSFRMERALYVDGEIIDTQLSGGTTTDLDTVDTDVLAIGKDNAASPIFLDGRINHLKIWDVYRKPDDIFDDNDAALTGTETGLIGYWKCDEGSGTNLADSDDVNNNDMTISGTGSHWIAEDVKKGLTVFTDTILEDNPNIAIHKRDEGSVRTTKPNTERISVDISFRNGLRRLGNTGEFKATVKFTIEYKLEGTDESDYILEKTFNITDVSRKTLRFNHSWEVSSGIYDVRIIRITEDHDDQINNKFIDVITWIALRSIIHTDPVQMDNVTVVYMKVEASDQLQGVLDNFNCVVYATIDVFNGSSWNPEETRNPTWYYATVLTDLANSIPILQSDLDTTALTNWALDNDFTLTFLNIVAGNAITINDVTFVAHPTTTTIADRQFNISGGDTTGAIELVSIINDEEFGVPSVTAKSTGAIVSLESNDVEVNIKAITTASPITVSTANYIDTIIDSNMTVSRLLTEIATVGRAAPYLNDGKYSVTQDKVQATASQILLPINSFNFNSSKNFKAVPHALRTRYTEPKEDWKEAELIVYADGFSEAGGLVENIFGNVVSTVKATVFEELRLWAVTDRNQARKTARYHLAVGRLRPEIYQVGMDIQNIRSLPGDRVEATHDVPQWGLGFARVVSVALSGGDAISITVNSPFTMVSGKIYEVKMELDDASIITEKIDTVVGDQKTLTFTTQIDSGDPQPKAGNSVAFGEENLVTVDLVIKEIESRPGLEALITLVDYSEDIFLSDTAVIPEFDPQISLPPDINRDKPPRPIFDLIVSDETALAVGAGNTLQSQIKVTFIDLSFAIVAPFVYESQFQESTTFAPWTPLSDIPADRKELFVTPVEDGRRYDVRVRSRSQTNVISEWSYIRNHLVIGKSTPPPNVAGLTLEDNVLLWPEFAKPPLDLEGFLVSYTTGDNANINVSTPLHTGVIKQNSFNVRIIASQYTFFVQAVDIAGNKSVTPAIVLATITKITDERIELGVHKFEDTGFIGAISGGRVSGDGLQIEGDKAVFFFGADNTLFYSETGTDLFYSGRYKSLTYQATEDLALINPDSVFPFIVEIELASTGDAFTISYYSGKSALFYGISTDLFYGAPGDLFYDNNEIPWPGKLVIDSGDELASGFTIRVNIASGFNQPIITSLKTIGSAPVIKEEFVDFAIAAGGTRLFPLKNSYTKITKVDLTIQDLSDNTAVIAAKVVDINETTGPKIHVYDSTNTKVSGSISGVITGYA